MSVDLVLATAYLTCGALMLFLGFVVLRENPRQRVNRATAGMLVFGGLGPILGAYSNLAARQGTAGSGSFTDVFVQFAFLWEFFFPATLLFALVFPVQHPILRRWPRLAYALFIPHAFHVLLVMLAGDSTNLIGRLDPHLLPFGQEVAARAAGVVRVGLELLLRIHVRFFSFINLSMAVLSWILLMRSARRTPNPKLRSQVRMIRLGIGLSLALYSGGDLVPTVFGLTIDRSLRLPLITVSLLVGAASIVVAIVRLQFLDVRFIVRRGLVYGLASGGIVALYLFAGKQMDRLSAHVVGEYIPFFETTFIVLSLFLLQPVLAGIERRVDGTYSRDKKDLRNTVTRLSEQIALLLDPVEVTGAAAATIQREMVLKSAAVATHDRGSGAYQIAVARGGLPECSAWSPGAVFFAALADRREPVSAREVVELPAEESERAQLDTELTRLEVETVIPLRAAAAEREKEIVGALMLGPKVVENRFTFEEMSLLSMLAHQLGISLLNGTLHKQRIAARLLEEEVATARKIQQNLLPEAPPGLAGWELCASNRPSRDVGGDYHDFLLLPEHHVGIAIGDVSGKGIPAALLMSNLQAALRIQALAALPTDKVVEEVNRHIYRTTGSESFISFFLGQLEPSSGSFAFTNAGHNCPLVVRRDGRVETLEDGGLLLGVFPEATYERGFVTLEPGDSIVFYTDGITEAPNPAGEFFSEERLIALVQESREATAEGMHDLILERVREFQEGLSPDDDLTLILLKRSANGVPPNPAATAGERVVTAEAP
jgi:serine phosphatase RsbU (regulator of sigma subunit)